MEEIFENGLVMRNLRDETDALRFSAFNGKFNNPMEGATCKCLLDHFGPMDYNDFFIIEDKSGDIAASICLILWRLNFGGISLKAAMIEMVLVRPDCRKLGLVRKLIKRCQQEIRTRDMDMSIITGIPFYYRQFGYSYALDLEACESLAVSSIHTGADCSAPGYFLRQAGPFDIPELMKYYNEACRDIGLFVVRDERHWEYLLTHANYDIRIIEDTKKRYCSGYLMLKQNENASCIDILEAAVSDSGTAAVVLNLLKTERTDEMRIFCPENSPLTELARDFGSVHKKNSQWLVNIDDPAKFLVRLLPLFDRRISESELAGITTDLVINFFKHAISIRIDNGKIIEIEDIGFVDSSMGADGGDLCIPPDAFIRLLFGYRNLEELWDAWPDTVVKTEKRRLMDILFPAIRSHLFTPYHMQTNCK